MQESSPLVGDDVEARKAQQQQPLNPAQPQPPVQLVFNNLTAEATVPTRKRLLDNVSGVFGPSELIAVMGPSGAGKTMLTDVLSGHRHAGVELTGELSVNGADYTPLVVDSCIRRVPQDDLLFAMMTPLEILIGAATFAGHTDPTAAQLRAEDLLGQFDLAKCKDVVVGDPSGTKGLSGGQKRRLSVAFELASQRSLLFLDEPTSGLDTVSAKHLAALLRGLARDGATVVCSIHQPSASIFQLFDKLFLLAMGKAVYFGPISASQPVGYFAKGGLVCPANHNPADFVIEVLTELIDKSSDKLDAFIANASMDKVDTGGSLEPVKAQPPRDMPTSMLHLTTLVKRHFRLAVREKAVIGSRIMAPITVGLLIGFFFWQLPLDEDGIAELINFTFFSLVFFLLSTLTPTLGLILPELAIVQKEVHNNHYSISAYYLAKVIVDLPLLLFGPLIYTALVSPMTGIIRSIGVAAGFYFALVTHVMATYGWTIMLCCLIPDMKTAMVIGPVLVMPLMLFSGFFRNAAESGWVFRILSYVDYVHYSFEMTVSNLLIGCDVDSVDRPVANGAFGTPVSGALVLTVQLGFPLNGYWIGLAGVWVLMVIFLSLGFVFLNRRIAARHKALLAAPLTVDPSKRGAAKPAPATGGTGA